MENLSLATQELTTSHITCKNFEKLLFICNQTLACLEKKMSESEKKVVFQYKHNISKKGYI